MLFVMKPEADEVPPGRSIVMEGLAAVEEAHVVQEADVAFLHDGADLVRARDSVYGIEGLGLAEANSRDSRSAGVSRRHAGQEAAREVEDDFGALAVEDCAIVVGRIAAVSRVCQMGLPFISAVWDGAGALNVRVKGPVWARESMDDVRASGRELVIYCPGRGHDAPAASSGTGLCKKAKDVADGIGVEGLRKSAC